MRGFIRDSALFVAGMVTGAMMMQPGDAQDKALSRMRLNHVGIVAKDFDESMRFYTNTMGFRETFTIRDKEGKPTLAYLQVYRDTFLELMAATPQRPAGLNHVAFWPEDLNAAVSVLREHGIKIDDRRTVPDGISITGMIDPNGVRLEMLDFLPGGSPRKAVDSWK